MIKRHELIEDTTINDELYLVADLPYVQWIQGTVPIKVIRTSIASMLWY